MASRASRTSESPRRSIRTHVPRPACSKASSVTCRPSSSAFAGPIAAPICSPLESCCSSC
jgi:hypothetical protein